MKRYYERNWETIFLLKKDWNYLNMVSDFLDEVFGREILYIGTKSIRKKEYRRDKKVIVCLDHRTKI